MKKITQKFASILAVLSIIVPVGFAPMTAMAAATATLQTVANGTYTAWTGDESDIDETSSFACDSDDSIKSTGANSRESFTLSIASIPNGSTITSVDITVRDRGDNNSQGTYRTFVRLDGSDTDAVANLAASGGSGDPCSSPKTQNVNVADTVKSGATTLEVGVVKINSTGQANNTVRIGTMTAVINYTAIPPLRLLPL